MSPRPPGLLRPHVQPDVLMMLCTAGHVDHGKTRLVRMLTGCRTDRLKEEIERGLTIDVGFAPCWLGGDLCAGIVDVPGHEKFIRNMVAGVSGIDLALLVVAADDGVMPQTVEHVRIMEILGVRHGLVALTKTDLVPPEDVARRTDELREFLAGTFLAGAPICPVSSETGDGFAALYETLVNAVARARRARPAGIFRMPVEKVFVSPGFGAVVTGIPVAGSIRVGDAVECVPGGALGRVRGVQRFLREASEGGAGQCLGLNIPEYGKTPPERGQVLCAPGFLRASTVFIARVQGVPGLPAPLRSGEAVKFHTGTAVTAGRVHWLDGNALAPGGRGGAVVVTEAPVAAAAGDRFLLRRASPPATVAGGRIAEAVEAGARPRRKEAAARLDAIEAFMGDADRDAPEGRVRRIEWALSGAPARRAEDLARETLVPPDETASRLAELARAGRAVDLGGGWFAAPARAAAAVREIEDRAKKAVAAGRLNVPLHELRRGLDWPAALWNRVRAALEQSGRLAVRDDQAVLQPSLDGLPEADRRLADAILARYEEAGFHSPRPDELPALVGAAPAHARRVLDYLVRQRRLVRVEDQVVLAYSHYRRAQDMAVETIRTEGVLRSPEFRDRLATSRKYAMALLDFMDARRITLRIGNDRRLRPDGEKNLL